MTLTRRAFLATGARGAAGLVVGFWIGRATAWAREPGPASAPLPDPNAFLRIGADDSVTIRLAHSELGQGIWTTLPMLVAEELECDWSRIAVEHAPAAPEYEHTTLHIQMTGGSTTTSSEFDRYRQVGALAREMLIAAAAQRFGVAPSACRAADGGVSAGDRRATFGELAEAAAATRPPASVTLKTRERWTRIGQPTLRLDSAVKVTGRAVYGIDMRLPGILTAVVARSPVFGGRVISFDADAARAVPGVRHVVEIPSGVAVVADHFWAARLGRDALRIEWDLGDGAGVDTDAMRAEYRRLADGGRGASAAERGDAAQALAASSRVIAAEYDAPFLAHATMEPLNCTVRIADGAAEVWAGTQFQTVDRENTAKILGLPLDRVRVHTLFSGGGFGRRATSTSDFVSEAAHLAKATRAPVKVTWTREDDMRGGYYRPQFFHRLRAALDDRGMPVAWSHVIVGQSIATGTRFADKMIENGVDHTSVEGAFDSPYLSAVAAHRVELHSPRSAVPVLWFRSVGHTHTAFAIESFIDELAHAAGRDPLDYRRALLAEHPRHLGALELAASRAESLPLAPGRARGFAVHESFGSFVAAVVEASVDAGRIRAHRVVVAIDSGVCVNPNGVIAQLEGATAFALTAALLGEITLREGRVQQSNFHDYRMLRIQDMPAVEAHVVESAEKPGGVGEPGVPPIAPALANAVFAATGRRLRRLPFDLLAKDAG